MRKFLFCFLSLGLVWISLISPVNTLSAETLETEEIPEESTPENNRRAAQNQTILLAMCSALILILVVVSAMRKQRLELFVDQVSDNQDGSYTITWGYKNPKRSKITFSKEETGLKVKKGTAIVLKQQHPNEFEPGLHKEAIITVINDGTEIEWIAGSQKVGVNGQMIKKERRDENEKN